MNFFRSLILLGAVALAFAVAGCSNSKTDAKPMRMYVQVDDTGSMSARGSRMMRMPDGMVFYVKSEPVILERHINNVDLVRLSNDRLAMLFYLNDEGASILYRTTGTERGRFVVFEYNGLPLGERMIDTVMKDGRYITFLSVPEDEMEELVLDMRENIAKIQKARAKAR